MCVYLNMLLFAMQLIVTMNIECHNEYLKKDYF